jgi:cytochrome c biogenesis protein CcdA
VVAGIAAFSVGLGVSALLLSFLLYLVGRIAPTGLEMVSPWVALILAAIDLRLLPLTLKGSSWRVPRVWGGFGPIVFGFGFGAVQGLGLLTALPSPAFYYVLVQGITQDSWVSILILMGFFSLGRFCPVAVITLLGKSQVDNHHWVDVFGLASL